MSGGLLDATGWRLVAGILAVLVVASIATLIVSRALLNKGRDGFVTNLRRRVLAWWLMIPVVVLALALGEWATILLFLVLSLVALREFLALSPVDRREHRLLVALVYITAVLQYVMVWQHWYGMFAVAIPVYAFLALSLVAALSGDTHQFLQRSATVLWALMACVFAMSHIPAVLQLPVAMEAGRAVAEGSPLGAGGPEGGRLLLWLVIVVQGSDVLQYVWGTTVGRRPIAPAVSPNKTWAGFVGGIACATVLGAALWWATPFTPWQAGLLALASCLLGFSGGLVMSAIKRDRGIKDFGAVIPGHGGVMDRLDSLVFAAPVFFHLVRFFFA